MTVAPSAAEKMNPQGVAGDLRDLLPLGKGGTPVSRQDDRAHVVLAIRACGKEGLHGLLGAVLHVDGGGR